MQVSVDPLVLRLVEYGIHPDRAIAAVNEYRTCFPGPADLEKPHILELLVLWPRAAWEVMDAAELISCAREARGGHEGVLRRFRTQAEYFGARAEAVVARLLVAEGLPFEFLPTAPPHSTPDIRVLGEPPFYIEVSHIEPSFEESIEMRLLMLISSALEDIRGYDIEFHFEGARVERLSTYRHRSDSAVKVIASEVADTLRLAVAQGAQGEVLLPNIGVATLKRAINPDAPLSPAFRFPNRKAALAPLERTLREKAKTQLMEHQPGVLVIDVTRALPVGEAAGVATDVLEVYAKEFEAVSGLVFVSVGSGWHGTFQQIEPVTNRHAKVRLEHLPWRAVHGPSSCWRG